MDNNLKPTNEQMNKLVQMAGERLGKDPEKMKEQMQNGQMDEILSSLPPDQKERVNSILQNPAAIEEFVQNPKIQMLLRGLMGGK